MNYIANGGTMPLLLLHGSRVGVGKSMLRYAGIQKNSFYICPFLQVELGLF